MIFPVETRRLKSIKVEVESSVIGSMEYSKEDFSLIIRFRDRGVFNKKVKRIEQVTPKQFFEMLSCESIGRAYLQLKNKMSPR